MKVILSLIFLFLCGYASCDPIRNDHCRACNELVSFSKSLSLQLKNEEVRNDIIKWCVNFIGSPEKMCHSIVDDVKSAFNKIDSNNLCYKINACYSFNEESSSTEPINGDTNGDINCDFCLTIFKNIKSLISSPKAKNELKASFLYGCNSLKDLKDECIQFLDQNLDSLFYFIQEKFDPNLICVELGSCSKDQMSPQSSSISYSNFDRIIDVDKFFNRVGKVKSISSRCILCSILTFHSFLQSPLKLNQSVFYETCDNLFEQESLSACYALVQQNHQALSETLNVKVPPQISCYNIGYCSINELKYNSDFFNKISFELTKIKNADFPECELCRKVTKYVNENIDDEEDEYDPSPVDIELLLNISCKSMFPNQEKPRKECENFVGKYLDELAQAMHQLSGSNEACVSIRVCKKTRNIIDASVVEPAKIIEPRLEVENVKLGPDCLLCETVIEKLYKIIKENKTEENIKEALNTICEKFSPSNEKEKCEHFVDKYFDQLVELVIQQLSPDEACILLHLCKKKRNIIDASVVEPAKVIESIIEIEDVRLGPICPLCKKSIRKMYEIIKENKTEENIKGALNTICENLPSKEKDECENFVDKYTDRIVQLVIQNEDPELICSLLFLCQSSIKTNPECDICKLAIEWIYHYIEENRTEEAIINGLEKVCKEVFRGKRETRCKSIVEQYTEDFIRAILLGAGPQEVCALAGLCEEGTREIERETERETERENERETERENGRETERENESEMERESETQIDFATEGEIEISNSKDLVCNICLKLFNEIHELLENNSSIIINDLEQLCYKTHSKNYQEKCVDFVRKYFREIVVVLESQTNPEFACSILHVCHLSRESNRVPTLETNFEKEIDFSENKNEVETDVNKFINSNTVCYECHIIVHFIQEGLYDFRTEEEITTFIKKEICSRILPSVTQQTCKSFVDEYGDEIIQSIVQKAFDPTTFCDRLRICPHWTTSSPNNDQNEIEFINPEKEETCQMCTHVVENIKYLYLNGLLRTVDTNSTLKVCQFFDETKKSKCEAIYNQVLISHFLQMIAFTSDTNKICKAIDLCYIPGTVHLLGGDKCLYGPTYWCHTSFHAEACKATNYCKQKVWKAVSVRTGQ